MDETLPDTLHMTSIYLMILLTSLAIVASGIPVYVCMIGALFLSFFMMQVRGGGCCGIAVGAGLCKRFGWLGVHTRHSSSLLGRLWSCSMFKVSQ